MAEYNTASFCKFNLDYDDISSKTKNTSLAAEINTYFNDDKSFTNYNYNFTLHNSDYYRKKIRKMCNNFKKDNNIRVISLKIISINNSIFSSRNKIIFIDTLMKIINIYNKTISVVEINLLSVNSKTTRNNKTIKESFLFYNDEFKEIAKCLNNIKITILSIFEFYLLHAKKTILNSNTINMLNHIKENFNKVLFNIIESAII